MEEKRLVPSYTLIFLILLDVAERYVNDGHLKKDDGMYGYTSKTEQIYDDRIVQNIYFEPSRGEENFVEKNGENNHKQHFSDRNQQMYKNKNIVKRY